jgi:hypothetical protein
MFPAPDLARKAKSSLLRCGNPAVEANSIVGYATTRPLMKGQSSISAREQVMAFQTKTDSDAAEDQQDGLTFGETLHAARPVTLRSEASAPETVSMVSACLADIDAATASAMKRARKPDEREGLQTAIGALLGDLLPTEPGEWSRANGCGPWLRYSTRKEKYFGQRVSFGSLQTAVDGMAAAGLIEVIAGNSQRHQGPFGTSYRRRAPRIQATPKLRAMAADFGVVDGNGCVLPGMFRTVWSNTAPKVFRPIELRRANGAYGKYGKLQGEKIELPDTDRVRALEHDAADLNAFIAGFNIGGCDAPAWRRIFAIPPDMPIKDYKFDLGGRLYAQYQNMPADQRAAITFNGEPSVDLDVRASHLTIFLHGHGVGVDNFDGGEDPYQPPAVTRAGIDRDAAKAYAAALFGSGHPPARWGAKSLEAYRKAEGDPQAELPPLGTVAEAMQRAYPCLREVNDPMLWGRLQYRESEALISALGTLAGLGVPALPTHDALAFLPPRRA